MIRVDNISKIYLVWKTPLSRLLIPLLTRCLGALAPVWVEKLRLHYCYPVRALVNISFSVDSGDSLGIIGLNGSGKSTLLQIIAGTLQPTEGMIELKGRVAALLELGSGFDPEFTGRENVYLNASILGLTRAEIDARYDAIVNFADIGDFIEHPVKTYSSGMMVRLAFAVQVHVDPDVLIVDEALAVGDARFQAKALAKIESILKSGTTLLFVGHDLNAVRAFCNRAILLDKGNIVKIGVPEDVINDYVYAVQKEKVNEAGLPANLTQRVNGFVADSFYLNNASFLNFDRHATLRFGDPISISFELIMEQEYDAPYLIFEIVDSRSLQLTGKRIPVAKEAGRKTLCVTFACEFQKGIYRIRVRLVNAPSIEQTTNLAIYNDILSFELLDDVRQQFLGLFPMAMTLNWQLQELG